MHTPDMITDLAVMLLTAGLITILFKKIKQPLILGYILAGFLISPYFPLFFNVEDIDSINLWSEIGVIILMFHIGLEFNLHKLAKLGGTAVISAIIKMGGVMLTGYLVGILMGFSVISSLFLGCMLSISSTAVIQKSFEELEIKGQKYSQLVMGTLVIEDIVGIFMMVVLSTISVSQSVAGKELMISLALMVCYLVVWLLLGIYLLPTFLNKVIKVMNDEMLLILSLGLCFGMVMIANFLGFSSELGAFLAGSLLAGTIHVERVEHLTGGVKDMFVSFFFLSVGMKVDPHAIVNYAPIIAVITVVAVIAKLIFATVGMLLSGQTLNTAVKSGFSLAPIGEFSFIIAALGVSLGVMEENLYPIIVSAAVITTFLTPFLIKNSSSVTDLLQRKLPESLLQKLHQYTSSDQTDDDKDTDWNEYIRKFVSRTALYSVIMLVAVMVGIEGIYPFLAGALTPLSASIATCAIIFFVIAIFVRPMLNPGNALFTSLWLKKRANRLPLIVLAAVRVILTATIAMIPISVLFEINPAYLFIFIIIAVLIAGKSNFLSTAYLRLETQFLRNLNERLIEAEEEKGLHQSWLDTELHIISLIAPESADFLGKHLADLQWGKVYNVYVVKIRHHGKHIILPEPKATIAAGDKVFVVGDLKSIENFYRLVQMKPSKPPRTLKKFMETDYPDADNALSVCAIKVTGNESYAGKTLKNGNIREKFHCMVLGVQQSGYPIIMPDINTLITKEDIIWVMGSNHNVSVIVAESVETAEAADFRPLSRTDR
ncbi:cation:proton antiporter [Senimuribacter intestinalis]|uniref:cation:proton antiporter n=1 Tax=Senimuribacter intestinalis TaxID=2941507 RepID=UPI00203D7154|nr:cation:proton antiporter [Senimuribacter intestinalis]